MSKTCKTVYLDSNGNLSDDYYNNLHLGKSIAESIYIDSMKNYAFSKFQKVNITKEELLEESSRVSQVKDGSAYTKSNAYGLHFV